jgi:feruloyl esterase
LVVMLPGNTAAKGLSCMELSNPGLFSNTQATSVSVATTRQGARYCKVEAVIMPTPGSRIAVIYRLPFKAKWSGRLLGLGGGAFGGVLNFSPNAGEWFIGRGYAVAASDSGHPGEPMSAEWGLKPDGTPNRDAIIDYAHRGIHLMTVVAKQVVRAYYGENARYAYYEGCSTGGRMGLVEVQRYPDDYDGVVVGAPVMHLSRVTTTGIWQGRAFHGEDAVAPGAAQLNALGDAVLDACDADDGVVDGVLNDPPSCDWDPAQLACEGSRTEQCLGPGELQAVRKIYAGPTTSDEVSLYVPIPPGGEENWEAWLLPGDRGPFGGAYELAAQYMRFLVFQDPDYDPMARFDFDRDLATVQASLIGVTADAVNPDIRPFIDSGGKLLMHHGWGDMLVPAQHTADYYQEIVDTIGPALAVSDGQAGGETALDLVRDHARLFMLPGTYHCSGGPGAFWFDPLPVIENWVENGVAPDRIVATHPSSGANDASFTRPLCPYPQLADYTGPPDDPVAMTLAKNFRCVAPE